VKQHGDARGEDGIKRVDVGRAPADHIADRHAVEVTRGQPQHVAEQPRAHLTKDMLSDDRSKIAGEERERLHDSDRGQVEHRER
jgi:hypothetical protein